MKDIATVVAVGLSTIIIAAVVVLLVDNTIKPKPQAEREPITYVQYESEVICLGGYEYWVVSDKGVTPKFNERWNKPRLIRCEDVK
jgi:hypothetical protein